MSNQPVRYGFGSRTASDPSPRSSGGSGAGANWIRYFKDGTTSLRIAPAETVNTEGKTVYGTQAWKKEYEHFDQAIRVSYPCPLEHGAEHCVGHESDNEAVRKTTPTYYVNALDKDGRMRIFKFGVTVFKQLEFRQQKRLAEDPENKQPLSDRDCEVTRTGKAGSEGADKINFFIEWGEKYPIDWTQVTYLDIDQALEDAYNEAVGRYTGEKPAAEDTNRNAAGVFGSASSSQHGVNHIKEQIEEDEEPAVPLSDTPTPEDLENAETTDLRRWLKDVAKAEFPERAPRARLLKIAKAALEPPF